MKARRNDPFLVHTLVDDITASRSGRLLKRHNGTSSRAVKDGTQ